jgi:hypothetical protein
MKSMRSPERRPAIVAALSLVSAALLAGCNPVNSASYRRQAAAEHDPVPPLYRGSLTVEYVVGRSPEVVKTLNGSRRIDWTYSSGEAHAIFNPTLGKTFYWSTFGPGKGKLEARRASPVSNVLLRRWYGRETAERLGPCAFAGETGRWYRYKRPPNFKEGDREFVQACITADGVLLAEGVYRRVLDPHLNFTRAVRVSRAPLTPDLFNPPTNLPPAG